MSNLLETLGLKTVWVTKNTVIISLNITDAVKQPYGILHGGVNAVMAETAASLGANENLDDNQVAVGVSIETHHLNQAKTGLLTATATPIKVGRNVQVWRVKTTVDQLQTSESTVTLVAQSRTH